MKKKYNFTLLELCIVVVTLSVLGVLLCGAVALKKEEAQMVKCANNLRRLSQAITSYGNDYEGYFFNEYGNLVDNYNYSGYARYAGYVGGPSYNELANNSSLRVQGNTPETFICPTLTMTSPDIGRFTYGMSYNGRNTPYYAAAKIFDVELKDNKGNVYAPSAVFLAADSFSNNYAAADCNRLSNSGYNPNFGFPQGRHPGDTANFMFIDGHAEASNPGKMMGKPNFLTNAKVQSFWIYFIGDERVGN